MPRAGNGQVVGLVHARFVNEYRHFAGSQVSFQNVMSRKIGDVKGVGITKPDAVARTAFG